VLNFLFRIFSQEVSTYSDLGCLRLFVTC